MYLILLSIAVVQIIIEMIPVSSSGHVSLLEKYGMYHGHFPSNWVTPEWFEYILNIPAIVVLVVFFWSEIWSLKRRLFIVTKDFLWHKKQLRWVQKKWLSMVFRLVGLVFLADIVTVIPYFICKELFACGVSRWQQSLGFVITALSLFSLSMIYTKRTRWCSIYDALAMGFAQGAATIFSCSRFGITLATAHALGFSFRRSAHFSFLIFFPLLLAASLKGLICMPSTAFSLFDTAFLMAIVFAAMLSYFALYAVWWLGQRGYLWYLGFYMIIPLFAVIFL